MTFWYTWADTCAATRSSTPGESAVDGGGSRFAAGLSGRVDLARFLDKKAGFRSVSPPCSAESVPDAHGQLSGHSGYRGATIRMRTAHMPTDSGNRRECRCATRLVRNDHIPSAYDSQFVFICNVSAYLSLVLYVYVSIDCNDKVCTFE
jgi:hypothetical protein